MNASDFGILALAFGLPAAILLIWSLLNSGSWSR